MAKHTINDFIVAYLEVSKQGGTNKDLAKKLGVTPSSVIARINKLIKYGVEIEKLGPKTLKQKILEIIKNNKNNPQEEILKLCLENKERSKKILPYLRKLKNPVFSEEFKNKILAHYL